MPTEKTELQWTYSPADFFEVPYRRETDDYVLVADGGVVRVTLCKPCDPIDAKLQSLVTKEVEGLFRLRQLRVHRPLKLNVFEAPGVEPVFLKKDQAINYAENRASFRSGEIRILDSSGNVEHTIPFNEADRKL
jgi:hypothetical protein